MEDIKYFDEYYSSYTTKIPIVKKFLNKNFPYLEKIPRIYKGLESYLDQGSYAAVFKIKGKDLALRIEVGDKSELSHYNFWEEIMNEQKNGNFKSFKRVVYMEKKELGNGEYASVVISKLYKPLSINTVHMLDIALLELYSETLQTNPRGHYNTPLYWDLPTKEDIKKFKLNIKEYNNADKLWFLGNSFMKIHNDFEKIKTLGFKNMPDVHSENIMQDNKGNLILIDF